MNENRINENYEESEDIFVLTNEAGEEAEFELQQSAYENKTEIKISLEDEKKSDLALSFARKFKDLTDEEVKRIQNLLDSI